MSRPAPAPAHRPTAPPLHFWYGIDVLPANKRGSRTKSCRGASSEVNR